MRRVRICTGCTLGFVSRMRIILSPFVSTKEIRSRCGSTPRSRAHLPPLSRQTLQSQPASRGAFRYAERTNRTATKALPSAAPPRCTLRDHRRRHLHSARKINYGHRGELFAGFVALSSLVTFNLLAGINLILLYSPPRRPDPFVSNLGGFNHFFLPRSPRLLPAAFAQDRAIALLLSFRAFSVLYLLDSIM